jgi:hypothetical protein
VAATMRHSGELADQATANSKADSASPTKIIDQSPASRPKNRAADRGGGRGSYRVIDINAGKFCSGHIASTPANSAAGT